VKQSDKPTIAWGVVQSAYPWRPAVREIISRTPKGVRLRSMTGSWRDNKSGDMCSLNELKAEFATEAEADAAVARSAAEYERHEDAVRQARIARDEGQRAFDKAVHDRRAAALAALKGDQT